MSKNWTSFEKYSFLVAVLALLVGVLVWVTAVPTRQSGNASSTGDNSPPTTGDNNHTEINDSPPSDSKDKPAQKPSEKDKP